MILAWDIADNKLQRPEFLEYGSTDSHHVVGISRLVRLVLDSLIDFL